MHVRGSSLSQPKVVEALRPFIVAFWGQSNREPIPEDQRPLYEASPGRSTSNVLCFVLDSDGKLRHSFDGMPFGGGQPLAFSPDAYGAYFAREIARGAEGLTLPKVEPVMRLPDAKDGVRLFIKLPGRQDSYGAPVVETVENRDEWKTLAYPAASRQIPASALSRWLAECYPPGVNEQLKPFGSIRGTLTLKPTGPHQALLSGKVKMGRTEADYDLFDGTFEAVVTYGAGTSVRGVVEGVYWRYDRPHNTWTDWKLTAAVESRPK
jgi:hypothetical protein